MNKIIMATIFANIQLEWVKKLSTLFTYCAVSSKTIKWFNHPIINPNSRLLFIHPSRLLFPPFSSWYSSSSSSSCYYLFTSADVDSLLSFEPQLMVWIAKTHDIRLVNRANQHLIVHFWPIITIDILIIRHCLYCISIRVLLD